MPHLRALLTAVLCPFLASAAAAEPIWGVNGHPLVSYSGVSTAQQLDYLKDLKLGMYRVDVPSTDKLAQLRALVDEAKSRNLSILPVLTPAFALETTPPDVLQQQAYDMAFTLVSAFKGEIAVWELGNEMENFALLKPCEHRDDGTQYSCVFGTAGGQSIADYYGPRWDKVTAVLKGLASGAHAADPSVRRAIGSAGWGHTGAHERLARDGVPWEITVWHMYGQDPEWALKLLARLERPIWITEFNHPFGSQKGEAEQAEGLVKTMARIRQLHKPYKIEAAFIYELMDETYWAPDYEAYMGLVKLDKIEGDQYRPGAAKPAYAAVKKAIAAGQSSAVEFAANGEIKIERRCDLEAIKDVREVEPQNAIGYAYCLTLGRKPDGFGMDGWTARLKGGAPIEQILAELLGSEEFATRFGTNALSHADFVRLMNRLLLDREPSAKILESAAADLDKGAMTRLDYQRKLTEADEFKSRHVMLERPLVIRARTPESVAAPKPEVRRFCRLKSPSAGAISKQAQVEYAYCLVLGRYADPLGLQTWSSAVEKGLGIPSLITSLLQSDEFQRKYGIAQLDNASFVTLAYRVLLNRDPDGTGLQGYVTDLDTGRISRLDVFSALVASEEFRSKQSVLFLASGASPGPQPAQ